VAFAVGSVVILLLAVVVTVLSFMDVVRCTGEYWVTALVLLFVEVPIYVVTLVFCERTKTQI